MPCSCILECSAHAHVRYCAKNNLFPLTIFQHPWRRYLTIVHSLRLAAAHESPGQLAGEPLGICGVGVNGAGALGGRRSIVDGGLVNDNVVTVKAVIAGDFRIGVGAGLSGREILAEVRRGIVFVCSLNCLVPCVEVGLTVVSVGACTSCGSYRRRPIWRLLGQD
jgi:hypothetical protein